HPGLTTRSHGATHDINRRPRTPSTTRTRSHRSRIPNRQLGIRETTQPPGIRSTPKATKRPHRTRRTVMKVQLKASSSGCWQVLRNGTVVDICPPQMWRQAYTEAVREAGMNEIPRTETV